ncbi:DUF502 domain-containing protein [candidate division TA06 bacterium]|uniref:DUF502 domain-containing protein n=1 Tax=candidate division TA06 bacterium TaxID=2250710 RepID=A0A933MIM5_UNCT6|nr:DUF502 domain-containing protein [candidate division TA06 bacterium]
MEFIKKQDSAGRPVKKYFLTGLVVMLPILLTAYLLWLLFSWSGQIFGQLLVYVPYLQDIPQMVRLVLGFVLLVLVIYAMGFLASHLIGRRLLDIWDDFISRVPLARLVYGTTKQFTDNFFSNRFAFRQVVAVEYPRPGAFALGFLTSEKTWEMDDGSVVHTVYLPNTPNPTGGRIMLVPPRRLLRVQMSVEEALKLIVSGGMVSPQNLTIANSLDKPDDSDKKTAKKTKTKKAR